MDFGLEGRVAVVTGAARGIGWAHCQALAVEGVRLALVDLDETVTDEAVAHLRDQGVEAIGLTADAGEEEAVTSAQQRVMERFGRLDILVNNAGIGVDPAYTVAEMPVDAWDRMMRAHMRSTFLWSRAVIPAMARRGFGRIVNTSSMNYTGGGRPGVAHYASAKAAVAGFTRTLAKEVGPEGITANAIAPGYVATALIGGFSDDMRDRLVRQNPKGRLCLPEEVASLVVYLCSAQAEFINGELICLDGGRRDFVWN